MSEHNDWAMLYEEAEDPAWIQACLEESAALIALSISVAISIWEDEGGGL
jgi:hypothetical protein